MAIALATVLVSALAACTTHGDDAPDAPTSPAPSTQASPDTLAWPQAVDPAQTDGLFFVVWTAVEETAAGPTALQSDIDDLAQVGYHTLPWDPACQSGAEEQLAGLTGYADPLGVGVAFATERDAGVFSSLYQGHTVSVTQGTYTCAR